MSLEASNMKEIKIFSETYTTELFRDVEQNIDKYQLQAFPYEARFPKGGTEMFIDLDFELNPNDNDVSNSIKLYEQLKNINETQASDPRLWTYLCHVTFWKYMRERWPVEKPINKGKSPIGRIKTRYFLKSLKLENLVRNGISRLWWYAHLTYDETNEEDHYELTRILLKNADFAQNILERSYGSNKAIRFAILKFFQRNPNKSKKKDVYRDIFKKINLVAGVKNLSFLDEQEIIQIIENITGK